MLTAMCSANGEAEGLEHATTRAKRKISIQLVTGVGLAAGRGGVSAHQRRAVHRIDEDDGDGQEGATAAGGAGSSGGSAPRDATAAGGTQSAFGGAEGEWLHDL